MPPRYAPILFALILSCIMSLMVSGISTLRAMGLIEGIFGFWMSAWIPSWLVAFPTALFVAPLSRHLVARIVHDPSEAK